MGTFGTRPEDVITDSRGNAESGVEVVLYPTKADALGQTNALGIATSVTGGSWPIDLDGVDDAWARNPAGAIYPVMSDAPRVSEQLVDTKIADQAAVDNSTYATKAEVAPAGAFPTTPTDFWKWRTALTRVRTGGGDAKILCVGDSTTAGVGSSGSLLQGSPYSYPSQLAVLLNGLGVPAARGLGIPGPSASNNDPRWTPGASWARLTPTTNKFSWGGSAADYQQKATATPANLVYTDTVLADRYDVYYLAAFGLGTFTATATGGAGVVVNTAQGMAGAVGQVKKVTISAAAAATTNTVTISSAPSTGDLHIIGVEPWLSTASKVRVGNAGVGASYTTDWAAPSAGVLNIGAADSIKAYAPDLTIISLGLNDASVSKSVATYTTALQTVVNAALVSGDVVVMPPMPPTSLAAAAIKTFVPQYVDVIDGWAYPYADLFKRWVDGDTVSGKGWYYDTIHPNQLGYADMAQMLAASLATV